MAELIANNQNNNSYNREIIIPGPDEMAQAGEDQQFIEMTPAYKKAGFEDIGHGILLAKDFMGETDLNFLKYQAEELDEDSWNTHPAASFFQGKISTNLKVEGFTSQFIDLMMPEYWTNNHQTVNRARPGDEMIEFGWGAWGSADYFLVYYFGEWEGGDIELVKNESEYINFKFKPKDNELYLLPLLNKERYLPSEVTSGIKYSFIDWVYRHGEWAIA